MLPGPSHITDRRRLDGSRTGTLTHTARVRLAKGQPLEIPAEGMMWKQRGENTYDLEPLDLDGLAVGDVVGLAPGTKRPRLPNGALLVPVPQEGLRPHAAGSIAELFEVILPPIGGARGAASHRPPPPGGSAQAVEAGASFSVPRGKSRLVLGVDGRNLSNLVVVQVADRGVRRPS